ncbi:hypothetical protein D3C85_1627200 [compost metagenome]
MSGMEFDIGSQGFADNPGGTEPVSAVAVIDAEGGFFWVTHAASSCAAGPIRVAIVSA